MTKKKSRDKGDPPSLVTQKYNASMKKSEFLLSFTSAVLIFVILHSVLVARGLLQLWLPEPSRTMSREEKRPAFPTCLSFSKKKSSPRSSSRFPLTPYWLDLHPCHGLNQILSRGMGSWPIPGAGAKSMHRQPTVSAFHRLPLPWTSDSKTLPKKMCPLSSKPSLHRGELNFKRINKFLCVDFFHYASEA